jgi:hypothetical protein
MESKSALTRWYIPWNWSGGFYDFFFFFLHKIWWTTKIRQIYKVRRILRSKNKKSVHKNRRTNPWYIPSCQRALKGRLQVRIPVRIGRRIPVRFGAHPNSHMIRIGTYFELDTIQFSAKLSFPPPIGSNAPNWKQLKISGNMIFAILFQEMTFLSSTSRTARVEKDWTRTRRHYARRPISAHFTSMTVLPY